MNDWRPRPTDVPTYRDELTRAWAPDGVLTHLTPTLVSASDGVVHIVPEWEKATFQDAALWYVGTDMCDLLDAAAPQLPDTPLTLDMVPDPEGLVIFERTLSGIDSAPDAWYGQGAGPVHVSAMLWGRAKWQFDGSDIIGISNYGMLGCPPWLGPLGGCIWPLGRGPEDPLADDIYGGGAELSDRAVTSMIEDRKRLMALWLLSSQPGLTSSIRRVQNRGDERRAKRTGRDHSVRVVRLRHQPPATEGNENATRTYRHRWTVAGHWRNQAVGQQWSERRPIYINSYLKGPEDAPLLSTPKVKVWTR